MWVGLCALAEATGMTAAAAAAKAGHAWVGEPATAGAVAVTLSLAVVGGLVEGIALGRSQAAGLRGLLGRTAQRRWVVVTVAVAGLGWAAASAPAALAGADDGAPPPMLAVLAGAAGIGLLMGALLGAAQASVLRGHVPHPWRWIGASAAAWTPAMVVIFAGATAPDPDWAVARVILLGAATGAVAGTVLGLVSGWFLPSLTQPQRWRRLPRSAAR
jgi:hypothetical protein